MKILMLFSSPPLPPPLDLGGTKRNLPFFLELVKYNDVSVLAFGTPEEEQLFRSTYGGLCDEVRFVNWNRPRILKAMQLLWLLGTGRSSLRMIYRPAMQQAINEMAAQGRFDLIHCCAQAFGLFRFPADIPVTSDAHDVNYDKSRRIAENAHSLLSKIRWSLEGRFGKREEIALCRKFDLLTTTTERDCQLFRKDLPDLNMAVVQNGAGKAFFEELGIQPEPFTMVFTGLFIYLPNSDGILYFLDEVFPRILSLEPQARIYVVGKSPTRQMLARASEKVIVTGFVDDVRPYMARGQVFVIPLLAGGGIRGKALEAMAMKRPIVTTTIGVEGIHLRHEESALFADTPDAFAKAVVRLFRDPGLRDRLTASAFATAESSYIWEAKGKELNALLRSVVEARAKKTSLNPSPAANVGERKAV
jgi:glycosyltransferase involved in cell wall biosynthesis